MVSMSFENSSDMSISCTSCFTVECLVTVSFVPGVLVLVVLPVSHCPVGLAVWGRSSFSRNVHLAAPQ